MAGACFGSGSSGYCAEKNNSGGYDITPRDSSPSSNSKSAYDKAERSNSGEKSSGTQYSSKSTSTASKDVLFKKIFSKYGPQYKRYQSNELFDAIQLHIKLDVTKIQSMKKARATLETVNLLRAYCHTQIRIKRGNGESKSLHKNLNKEWQNDEIGLIQSRKLLESRILSLSPPAAPSGTSLSVIVQKALTNIREEQLAKTTAVPKKATATSSQPRSDSSWPVILQRALTNIREEQLSDIKTATKKTTAPTSQSRSDSSLSVIIQKALTNIREEQLSDIKTATKKTTAPTSQSRSDSSLSVIIQKALTNIREEQLADKKIVPKKSTTQTTPSKAPAPPTSKPASVAPLDCSTKGYHRAAMEYISHEMIEEALKAKGQTFVDALIDGVINAIKDSGRKGTDTQKEVDDFIFDYSVGWVKHKKKCDLKKDK